MGYLFVDFCRADEDVVANLNGVTAVRGPFRNAQHLGGPQSNPPRQEDRRFLCYDLRRNTEGGWDFVCNTRDILDRILNTDVKSSHPTFQGAYADLTNFLKHERSPARLVGRLMYDGTFNQKALGNTEGEVSLPAVQHAIVGVRNPMMH